MMQGIQIKGRRFGLITLAILALLELSHGRIAYSQQQTAKPPQSAGRLRQVLVFSKTGWYRHPEIPSTNGWLVALGVQHGFKVDVTETPEDITPQRLQQCQVLVLNNANELGKVLNDTQKQAIVDWYRRGGGIVGLHAALVHQTDWPWLAELGGCDFDSDSDFSKARVVVDPAAKHFAGLKDAEPEFFYAADWHNHTRAVTGLPGFQVLLRVDESTYEPVRPYFKERGGKAMGKDHPCAWTHLAEGGKFFYTDLGHDLRSLDTPFGRKFISEAIRWAAGD